MKDDYSRMVVGFVFDERARNVLLVLKENPSWQRGIYNGTGGKCKEGEPFVDAIVREANEEIDLVSTPDQWTHFLTLYSGKVTVAFFFTRVETCVLTATRSKTKEAITIIPRRSLADYKTIPNLQWLIPLAAAWEESLLPVKYAQAIEVFEVQKSS